MLRNETGRPIRRIQLAVNYLDANGQYLFGILYGARTEDEEFPAVGFRPHIENVLNKPIENGELFVLDGTNLLTTTTLPSSAAAVSVVASSYARTAGRSQVPAKPLYAPQSIEVRRRAYALPEEVLVKAKVDVRGRVAHVELMGGPSEVHESVFQDLQSGLRKWRFYPKTYGGIAIESELNIAIRFYAHYDPFIKECFNGNKNYPQSFAIVNLVPVKGKEGVWTAYYAGQPLAGEFGGSLSSRSNNPYGTR